MIDATEAARTASTKRRPDRAVRQGANTIQAGESAAPLQPFAGVDGTARKHSH